MPKITIKDYHNFLNKGKSKYRNIKTEYNGVMYDSKAEAKRAMELDILLRAGQITYLERQPRFPIGINGVKVFTYIADFRYITSGGVVIVEDVKGMKTPMFNLKKKCVEAYYGIEIKLI